MREAVRLDSSVIPSSSESRGREKDCGGDVYITSGLSQHLVVEFDAKGGCTVKEVDRSGDYSAGQERLPP